MDDLMKLILASAMEDALKNKPSNQKKEEDNFKVLAEEVAKNNRQLYEAHINVGFTSEEALELTTAIMGMKKGR